MNFNKEIYEVFEVLMKNKLVQNLTETFEITKEKVLIGKLIGHCMYYGPKAQDVVLREEKL